MAEAFRDPPAETSLHLFMLPYAPETVMTGEAAQPQINEEPDVLSDIPPMRYMNPYFQHTAFYPAVMIWDRLRKRPTVSLAVAAAAGLVAGILYVRSAEE